MAPTRRTLGRALTGLTALSALPALAACGGGGEATLNTNTVTQATTLVYWTNLGGADGSTMKELAERFQAETPLVTVEQIQGLNPYFDKVLAAVAAGTPPHVLGTRMPYVPFLAQQGVIADLSQKEVQQLGLRADDFEPTVRPGARRPSPW
jgi:ABC-type glycerol-3-phosphate transport system substrate-binding protein